MSDQTDRLIMQVTEPWNFGSEPVRLSVKERASPNRWTVSVTSGWSPAGEAVLAARYEGQTLLPLEDGEEVIASLTAVHDPPSALIGAVRADPTS